MWRCGEAGELGGEVEGGGGNVLVLFLSSAVSLRV